VPNNGFLLELCSHKKSKLLGANMATSQNQKNRKNNSMLTKTGKTRLGPLNASQLDALLQKSTKPKEQAKIKRAISQRPALAPKPVPTE
jgi:hypothetical protein